MAISVVKVEAILSEIKLVAEKTQINTYIHTDCISHFGLYSFLLTLNFAVLLLQITVSNSTLFNK